METIHDFKQSNDFKLPTVNFFFFFWFVLAASRLLLVILCQTKAGFYLMEQNKTQKKNDRKENMSSVTGLEMLVRGWTVRGFHCLTNAGLLALASLRCTLIQCFCRVCDSGWIDGWALALWTQRHSIGFGRTFFFFFPLKNFSDMSQSLGHLSETNANLSMSYRCLFLQTHPFLFSCCSSNWKWKMQWKNVYQAKNRHGYFGLFGPNI